MSRRATSALVVSLLAAAPLGRAARADEPVPAAAPAAAPAPAQAALTPDQIAKAKQFFFAGQKAYEAGLYRVAAQSFEEAYKIDPRASFLYNGAQAYRRQYFVSQEPGLLRRALDTYQEYVRLTPTGGNRDQAVQYISELTILLLKIDPQGTVSAAKSATEEAAEARKTQLMVVSEVAGAKGRLDGGALADLPLIVEVTPGAHAVRVEAAGYFPADRQAVAVEGQLLPVEVALREMPAQLGIHTAVAGARVVLDGRTVAQTPVAGRLELAKGRHHLAVLGSGRMPFERDLDLAAGAQVELSPPLERTTLRKVALWTFAGAGALALGATTTAILAFRADSKASDLQRDFDRGGDSGLGATPDDLDEYEHQRSRRDDLRAATFYLLGGTALAGAAGVLAWVLDDSDAAGEQGTTLSPTVLPGGAGASASVRF